MGFRPGLPGSLREDPLALKVALGTGRLPAVPEVPLEEGEDIRTGENPGGSVKSFCAFFCGLWLTVTTLFPFIGLSKFLSFKNGCLAPVETPGYIAS